MFMTHYLVNNSSYTSVYSSILGFKIWCFIIQLTVFLQSHLYGGMYSPPGYAVAACHDCTHHGSGVLLLCKNYLLVAHLNSLL